MSQNKETKILVLSLLLTLGLLGIGLLLFKNPLFNFSHTNNSANNSSNRSDIAANPKTPQESSNRQGENKTESISFGEKTLVPGEISSAKQAGITAIAKNNLTLAVTSLQTALQNQKNDPESLIYLNNALIGNNQSYQIAVSVPLTNDLNIGLEMLRGVAQAQQEINQGGGIKGKKLKVAIANDEGNPDIAKQVANQLIKNSQILAVVGPYSSSSTLAAGEIYNQGQLVAISPTSTSVKITNFSPYVFRTVPSDFIAARSLANHMVKRLQKRKAVVFFNSQSQYSQSLKGEFVAATALEGGQIVSEFDVSRPDFSAAKSFTQAEQQGAEAIMFATDSGSLDKSLQVIQINQQKLTMLGGDDHYAIKTLEIGRDQAVGMVIAIPWHIQSSSSAIFVNASRQLWGADVSWRSALAYDATKALAKAIEQDVTRVGIQKTLIAGDFSAPGADQDIRFLPSGDRNGNIRLVKVEKQANSRSRTGYDFVPLPE